MMIRLSSIYTKSKKILSWYPYSNQKLPHHPRVYYRVGIVNARAYIYYKAFFGVFIKTRDTSLYWRCGGSTSFLGQCSLELFPTGFDNSQTTVSQCRRQVGFNYLGQWNVVAIPSKDLQLLLLIFSLKNSSILYSIYTRVVRLGLKVWSYKLVAEYRDNTLYLINNNWLLMLWGRGGGGGKLLVETTSQLCIAIDTVCCEYKHTHDLYYITPLFFTASSDLTACVNCEVNRLEYNTVTY